MSADVAPAPGTPAPQVSARRDRPVARRVLALLIVACWVTWAIPAWQSSLHEVRPHELVADIEAGRVVGYEAVENVRQPLDVARVGLDVSWMSGFAPDYGHPALDAEGRPDRGTVSDLLYTLDGGRTRWAELTGAGLDGESDVIDALRASGARPFSEVTAPPNRDWAAYPGLFMALLVIGSLVAQAPRWGTRPFWVLVAIVTAGLGMVAYAVRELVLDPPVTHETRRLRWFHGLLVAVVGGLVLPPLLGLLI